MTRTSHSLITITDVSRSFGSVLALDQVSLDIRENEFFALLGPSGCGKTTLLRVLAGFEHPDSGTVTIGDQDLLALPPNKRPINMMFQSYALFPHMSVERNVAYGLQREGLPKDEIRDRVAAVLATVGLSAKASARPAQLSGGQRQRVALARAMVKRPRLLLLDEPLSALDRKVRAEMQLELKRLQHEAGITFVVVTHDQEEAMSMADRIAVMSEGRVQQTDSPVDLYQRPANMFVADFIGTSNVFTGMSASGAATGTDDSLVARPEDIRLVDSDSALLSGTVIDTQFFGGTSTIAVRVDGHAAPVTVTCQGTATVQRGDEVHLAWPANRAVVIPAEDRAE